MGYGQIGFAAPGHVAMPSPSIWADCGQTILKDKGLGVFFNQDFNGDYTTPAATAAPGIETFTGAGTTAIANAASSTYGPHVLSVAPGGSSNNNVSIYGEELGQIVLNSGRKLWFECRLAVLAPVTVAGAWFAGLTTRAAAITASTGVIAASPVAGYAALVSASFAGFVSHENSTPVQDGLVGITYEKGTASPVTPSATPTNGTLADVTNATALQTYQSGLATANIITQAQAATAQQTGPIGEGLFVGYGALIANGFRKFGCRFDGYKTLSWFVDGIKVSATQIDGTFDQTAYWVPVIETVTGASTANTIYVDWIRAAYQSRF